MNYNTVFTPTARSIAIATTIGNALSIALELVQDIDTAYFQPAIAPYQESAKRYLKEQFLKDCVYGIAYSAAIAHVYLILPTVHFVRAFYHVANLQPIDSFYAEENLPEVTEITAVQSVEIFATAALVIAQPAILTIPIDDAEVSENADIPELQLSEMTLSELKQYAKDHGIKGWNLYKSTEKLLAKIEAVKA